LRKRTRARELALQMLYQFDVRGEDARAQMEPFLRENGDDDEEVRSFARLLIEGTREKQAEIDVVLAAAAQNWQLRRMAVVDRNILRMAVWEMLHSGSIPAKVTINEAIELGKRFSTQQSGAFINGILDRIRREREL
jgi:transcription antitermination factor NusB